jgi:uncharacterized protein with HEPN domain
MSNEINKWLFDILEAIQSINQYIGEIRKFELYEKDKNCAEPLA